MGRAQAIAVELTGDAAQTTARLFVHVRLWVRPVDVQAGAPMDRDFDRPPQEENLADALVAHDRKPQSLLDAVRERLTRQPLP